MEKKMYDNFVNILRSELKPALGCTEPIALAYAGAKAKQVLGMMPEKVTVDCSGNIIKNVKGVTVPNSNGMKGIEVAVILGIIGGDADNELEVLQGVTQENIAETKKLVESNYCTTNLEEGVENLYIKCIVEAGEHKATVTIVNHHTFITEITKDGEIIFDMSSDKNEHDGIKTDKGELSIERIYNFANEVEIEDVREVIERQIVMNSAIADEGMTGKWGVAIGKTLLEVYGNDVAVRAKARAAAGSDARMSGCSLPVVINSGSGNQGMTIALPVIEYAKEWNKSQEELIRAIVLGNLVAMHQKKYIGSLSAFCGAASAGFAAGAAITFLAGGSLEQVALTITNALGNTGGMICDGAKPSCAVKIATSVDAGIMAHYLAMKNKSFSDGEGIVKENIEQTMKCMGYIAKEAMKDTDEKVLNLMIDKIKL